ncbi:MAG TPA: site-specific DNA-methyltransferase [Cyclobacteriaceae bacterium]|nr:site-specific DNA-methyltransferase [Cyclobacteriaceae bacterium]
MGIPPVSEPKDAVASMRLTRHERTEMKAIAKSLGFRSFGDYVRFLHNKSQDEVKLARKSKAPAKEEKLTLFHTTKYGKIYNGDSLDYLFYKAKPKSVNLIVTSPPFGLTRQKSYGNEDADQYCKWFRPFAEGFRRVLEEDGSLVIDIGGAWKPGIPTRSLYHYELLIMLCKEFGFHLCQEHYWWNPAKLPTPAEWVNVRRVRVKDAVNCIWWLSLTPFPKANNRRVLSPYSPSMHHLLENGYKPNLRPSGHDISDKFQKNNGGAVPPNLLAIANTESQGQYLEYCRDNGIRPHPARFPHLLPEYFIRLLTDPGDLVLDPFAGSCVTGMVAERMKRKWTAVEMNSEYLRGALSRFSQSTNASKSLIRKSKPTVYEISSPCPMPVDEVEIKLAEDGGTSRKKK